MILDMKAGSRHQYERMSTSCSQATFRENKSDPLLFITSASESSKNIVYNFSEDILGFNHLCAAMKEPKLVLFLYSESEGQSMARCTSLFRLKNQSFIFMLISQLKLTIS